MGGSVMDNGNFDKSNWMLSDLDSKIQAEKLVTIADVKSNLYRCKDTIMNLVYLAKCINTHEQLPQEYKDLMKHYALQIEKVMGDKL